MTLKREQHQQPRNLRRHGNGYLRGHREGRLPGTARRSRTAAQCWPTCRVYTLSELCVYVLCEHQQQQQRQRQRQRQQQQQPSVWPRNANAPRKLRPQAHLDLSGRPADPIRLRELARRAGMVTMARARGPVCDVGGREASTSAAADQSDGAEAGEYIGWASTAPSTGLPRLIRRMHQEAATCAVNGH